jgi:stage III sporulation protein AD
VSVFQVVIVGVLGVLLALLVKRQAPEIAVVITFFCGVVIFLLVLPMLSEAVGFLRHLGAMADGMGEYTSLALRVIGVAYMAELGAGVCHDGGETAIAAKIDLAGRVIIIVMAMPVVLDIVRVVTGLLP